MVLSWQASKFPGIFTARHIFVSQSYDMNLVPLACEDLTVNGRFSTIFVHTSWLGSFICLLDDLLNIDNPYFEQMVGQIYPTELQLNKANSSDTEAPFLDLNLSITHGIISSKTYDMK